MKASLAAALRRLESLNSHRSAVERLESQRMLLKVILPGMRAMMTPRMNRKMNTLASILSVRMSRIKGQMLDQKYEH
ncbi:MAG: hypothetical protein SGPRY_011474 [Prymnesium sp.]